MVLLILRIKTRMKEVSKLSTHVMHLKHNILLHFRSFDKITCFDACWVCVCEA
jgi:hypothetical protein